MPSSTVVYSIVVLLTILSVVAPAAANKDEDELFKGMCTWGGGCNSTAGKKNKWKAPEGVTCSTNIRTSSSTPYCWAGSKKVHECCNACRNMTASAVAPQFACQYWGFFPNPNSCSSRDSSECGRCFLYPFGSKPETGGPNNSPRVGRICPFTKNDPHFLGAQGTRFEFNGIPDKTFCLYTDKNVHINMKMTGYYDSRTVGASILKDGKAVRTWIRELAIMWRDAAGQEHSFVVVARAGKSQGRDQGYMAYAELDSAAVPSLHDAGESVSLPGGLVFTFHGVGKAGPFEMDNYNVKIGDLIDMELGFRVAHPLLQTETDAMTHINVQFNDMEASEQVHGIMGQTYRTGRNTRAQDFAAITALLHHPIAADGETGKGFLDGQTSDYVSSGLESADCKFTAFKGRPLPATAK